MPIRYEMRVEREPEQHRARNLWSLHEDAALNLRVSDARNWCQPVPYRLRAWRERHRLSQTCAIRLSRQADPS